MRRAGAIAAVAGLVVVGCQSAPKPLCPPGQAELRTARLFLSATPPARLNEAELTRFIEQEVAPRFPDGVTVVDGGGQWKGDENRLIREAAKVVLIVLPAKGDAAAQIQAVQGAYRARFRQDSVVALAPPACVTP